MPIRYVRPPMRSVGEIIVKQLAALPMARKALASQLGVDPSTVTKIIKGDRKVAVAEARRWCQLLKLTGASADEFVMAVHVSHATPELGELLSRLQADHQHSDGMLLEYERQVADLLRCAERLADIQRRRRRSTS